MLCQQERKAQLSLFFPWKGSVWFLTLSLRSCVSRSLCFFLGRIRLVFQHLYNFHDLHLNSLSSVSNCGSVVLRKEHNLLSDFANIVWTSLLFQVLFFWYSLVACFSYIIDSSYWNNIHKVLYFPKTELLLTFLTFFFFCFAYRL